MDTSDMIIIGPNRTQKAQPLAWFSISFKNPYQLWSEHWFMLVFEIASVVILFQLLRNAKRKSRDAYYMILASMLVPMGLELWPIIPTPGYQLWWYHQGLVNILNQKMPLYIMTSFAIVHTLAHNLTEKCHLPPVTRSVVTAVAATLLNFPCTWLAKRLLVTFLHFDDPLLANKLLGVPTQQVLVQFIMFFHASHQFWLHWQDMENTGTLNYVGMTFVSGVQCGIYAAVEQYLLYMLVTLILGLNSGFCIPLALAVMLYFARWELKEMKLLSWSFDDIRKPLKTNVFWSILGFTLFIATLPAWLNFENLKSNGCRVELGHCNIYHKVANSSPLEWPRRRYVCPDDSQRLDFDFHCVDNSTLRAGVESNVQRYTVCGKPLESPHETAANIGMFYAVCLVVFYNLIRARFRFEVPRSEEAKAQ